LFRSLVGELAASAGVFVLVSDTDPLEFVDRLSRRVLGLAATAWRQLE
jgi:hypothetical protein